jgi:hypothetical protein
MKNELTETVFGKKLDQTFTLSEALDLIGSYNLLDIGELAERAISKRSGVAQCSKNTPGIDLESGVQIKHAQTNPNNSTYDAQLKAWCSIKNTTAPILLVITERATKRQYFFHIPYLAYSHVSANTIGIPFHRSGLPYRSNRWWRYEVDSFDTLCELASA